LRHARPLVFDGLPPVHALAVHNLISQLPVRYADLRRNKGFQTKPAKDSRGMAAASERFRRHQDGRSNIQSPGIIYQQQ